MYTLQTQMVGEVRVLKSVVVVVILRRAGAHFERHILPKEGAWHVRVHAGGGEKRSL